MEQAIRYAAALDLLRSIACALLLVSATSVAQQVDSGSALIVVAVSGSAEIERLGEHHPPQVGEVVAERDVLRLDDDGHVALRLAQSGVLELGPHAELSVEKLPSGKSRKDRKSIFNLAHGGFRIAWAPPAEAATPLYVYFSGQRARLDNGEYFFEGTPATARVCIASGELAATPITASNPHVLKAPACYRLKGNAEPENIARDATVWPGMRRNFTLDTPILPEQQAADPSAPATSIVSATPPGGAVETSHNDPRPSVAHADTPSTSGRLTHADGGPLPQTVNTPVVDATATNPIGSGWAINIASYSERTAAEQQAAVLRDNGNRAVVQNVKVDGRDWFRVQVRGFKSSEAAHAQMQALKAKPGYANAWVVRVD